MQGTKSGIYKGKWALILDCNIIQASEVYTRAQRFVLFFQQRKTPLQRVRRKEGLDLQLGSL